MDVTRFAMFAVPVRFIDEPVTRPTKLDVPLTFSEVPDMDVPEMFDAMRFAETIFARLLVPLIFSEVPM